MDNNDKLNLDVINPTEDELSNLDIVSFYNSFNKSLEKLNNNFKSNLKDKIINGNRKLYNKTITESKSFDDEFLNVLESAFPAFLKISKDPKKSIKYEDDIVGVSKARKIDNKSIAHLASHTQFIREVKNDGSVIPDKILTSFAEEDISIYENRMYKTLVNNIIRFLTRRKNILSENVESSKTDEIRYDDEVSLDDKTINVSFNVKIKSKLLLETKKSKDILDRIENMLNAYKGLKGTPFMKALSTAKDVYPPILKTNIILHNPDFKIVYNTWIFMERYSVEPYGVDLKEEDYTNDSIVDKDFSNLSLALVNSLLYYRNNLEDNPLTKFEEFKSNFERDLELNHDITLNSGKEEIENFTSSELFLRRTLEYFNQTYETQNNGGMSKDLSARETFRDIINILNHTAPNLFDYKDTDLDTIGKDLTLQIKEQEERYNLLKILREEKELDIEKTKIEEEKALEHLNELRQLVDETLIELTDINRVEENKRRIELLKAYEEEYYNQVEHQKDVIKRHKDEIKELARVRAVKYYKRGFHSRLHVIKLSRFKRPLQVYDNIDDDILELFNAKESFTLKSKRDHFDSPYKSLNEIKADIILKKALEDERKKKEYNELVKSFKYKGNRKRELKKDKISISIYDNTDTLDLFKETEEFDIYQKRFKHLHKKKISKKIVGVKKTLVKSRKLKKEEIELLDNKKKVIGSTKKLVKSRVIK